MTAENVSFTFALFFLVHVVFLYSYCILALLYPYYYCVGEVFTLPVDRIHSNLNCVTLLDTVNNFSSGQLSLLCPIVVHNKSSELLHVWAFLPLSISFQHFEQNVYILSMTLQHEVCKHDVSEFWAYFTANVYIFRAIAQYIWTQLVLIPVTILLTFEFHIFALWMPVNQVIKTFRRKSSSNQGQFLLIKNLDPSCKRFYKWHTCSY